MYSLIALLYVLISACHVHSAIADLDSAAVVILYLALAVVHLIAEQKWPHHDG